MTRRRVLWLATAGLVIVAGVVAVFLLPYLHRRAYPYPPILSPVSYTWPEDARIVELGSADHIRSEADALAYIHALRNRTVRPLSEFDEERLARAEYAAIRDPQKRIPESAIVKTYDALVDQLGAPASNHVTVEELHVFRTELLLYPRAMERLPDGSLRPDCRPIEAFNLLSQLIYSGGVWHPYRTQVGTARWLWSLLPTFWPSPPKTLAAVSHTQKHRFAAARERYFASHPDFNSQQLCNDLFSRLGIN
jgi:hypothetical protein